MISLIYRSFVVESFCVGKSRPPGGSEAHLVRYKQWLLLGWAKSILAAVALCIVSERKKEYHVEPRVGGCEDFATSLTTNEKRADLGDLPARESHSNLLVMYGVLDCSFLSLSRVRLVRERCYDTC